MADKDMLGRATRKLEELPKGMLGSVLDLLEKLNGNQGDEWLTGLKRLLRKEIRHPTEKIVQESFVDLLNACEQTWHDPNIIEKRFPLEPPLPDDDDWEVRQVVLINRVCFETISYDKIIHRLIEMEAIGKIRMVGPCRAMRWIAKHPFAQKHHSVLVPLRDLGRGGKWSVLKFGTGVLTTSDQSHLNLADYNGTALSYDTCLVLCRKGHSIASIIRTRG